MVARSRSASDPQREVQESVARINQTMARVARRTGTDVVTLWVIEGTASYGDHRRDRDRPRIYGG